MQPHLKAQMAQLRAKVEDQNRLHERRQQADARAVRPTQGHRHPLPLDAQILDLMRALPPQVRQRPWSMAELVQRLAGKYRERPHAQQVGDALRRLGWRRVRLWKGGADGLRVWVQG
jgi:hypothetical protein